ncbi:Fic family protein [Methanococcoides alaskense]|uniref:Fido (Protein-threonine AMPylation protein) n=1 Tax=Methanococcoides alaskense TaxID=325778 RepID=A0AA90TXR6_9EURY|nr:Fic family protein [Methanococcoides alaskense]MDA0525290.1 Fic family protein [Methanococcoides alaskense]MDR6221786.1 fido (protein-threonine AMPylation protein) [Methanococcoides alaskense]
MAKRPYRVEVNYPKDKKPRYFLVKDVWFKGKKSKIKKSLGTNPPSEDDIKRYTDEFAFEIEFKVAEKKAEFSSNMFNFDYLNLEKVKEIERLRFLYKTFTELLTTNEIEAYEQSFEINYVQGTTSIEGNTFSLQEARDLLVDGIIPKDKPLREINEIQNFKKVKQYRDNYKGKVTIEFIKNLHYMIMDNIDYESAGIFRRTDDIVITGCDLQVAPSLLIEDDLTLIINEYYSSIENNKYTFEQAVLFHYKFEMIHPFADGNGRVGREIFNYMLNRENYPKLLFLGDDREMYIKSLKYGNKDEFEPMVKMFVNLILSQRYEILIKNLRKVVIPQKRGGQMRLTDFDNM